MKLSTYMEKNLKCPITGSELEINGDNLESLSNSNINYPIIDGCPVIINEKNSIFKTNQFKNNEDTTINLGQSKIKKIFSKLMPTSSNNLKAKNNYIHLIKILPKEAKILVLGGSYKGEGMEDFYTNKNFDLVGSDVSFGPDCNLICDAHDIPFIDETFDCVVVQAVLEHVLDPKRCVNEIYRVLNSEGIVYAETPFMQQVHMQQYDFTRYTHLGHRRLFRKFFEIDSGPVGGPGMALAWAYIYFLRSFSSSPWASKLLMVFGKCTSFFLKYFDYLLIDKPGSYDAAAGYFFMGRKSNEVISDLDLLKKFKGI
jgi:SAM-dependent methyltransferase